MMMTMKLRSEPSVAAAPASEARPEPPPTVKASSPSPSSPSSPSWPCSWCATSIQSQQPSTTSRLKTAAAGGTGRGIASHATRWQLSGQLAARALAGSSGLVQAPTSIESQRRSPSAPSSGSCHPSSSAQTWSHSNGGSSRYAGPITCRRLSSTSRHALPAASTSPTPTCARTRTMTSGWAGHSAPLASKACQSSHAYSAVTGTAAAGTPARVANAAATPPAFSASHVSATPCRAA
mmetsp:Transcript_21550/g.51404  ORF Transcript_21550/g.51404 Transcript_21550/m.51404 type:complete len:236 (+) Transcript_21550:327-1034(+)